MNIYPTDISDVLRIEPRLFADDRGYFFESYHQQRYADAGLSVSFVQDNYSSSRKGTLRGLHYQIQRAQGKLVWVTQGEIFDVAVDLRRNSDTFGKWAGVILNDRNRWQLYIPPGFAHGFCVLSDTAEVSYKCTDYYHPEHERTIRWDDPDLGIAWPIREPLLSDKDRRGLALRDAPHFA